VEAKLAVAINSIPLRLLLLLLLLLAFVKHAPFCQCDRLAKHVDVADMVGKHEHEREGSDHGGPGRQVEQVGAGKAGAVIVPLCGPCKSGVTKTVTVSSAVRDAIERNGTYVNVHTAKNLAGEIRGQVKSTE